MIQPPHLFTQLQLRLKKTNRRNGFIGFHPNAIRTDGILKAADRRWTTSGYYRAAKDYAANTEERHQFLPIPMKELGVNLLLKQNSYWSSTGE